MDYDTFVRTLEVALSREFSEELLDTTKADRK
jgi:hypothetical protein